MWPTGRLLASTITKPNKFCFTSTHDDTLVRAWLISAFCVLPVTQKWLVVKIFTHLLQLIMMSSGLIRRFSMPIFGWSPRPRKRPGGSMRKFPILSLWLSMMQKPYSWMSRSFSSLIFYIVYKIVRIQWELLPCFQGLKSLQECRPTCFSSFDICFLASDWALKYSHSSLKSHLFRSVIFDFSSDVIS